MIQKITLIFIFFLIVAGCIKQPVSRIYSQDELDGISENWQIMLEVAGDDSLEQVKVKNVIREQARDISQLDLNPIALYTAYEGYLLLAESEDSLQMSKLKSRIRKKFPDSEQTYNIASAEFYDRIYPIWYDDSLKVIEIADLLHKYPQTSWRRTMYQYLLYSLNAIKETDKLKKQLKKFRQAFPEDYLPYYLSARYYHDNDIDPDQSLAFIATAWVKVTDYPALAHYPSMQWELERRSAPVNTTGLYAEILNSKTRYEEAEEILRQIISVNELGVDDETTLSRCYYQLSESLHGQLKNKEAAAAAVTALIAGDSRNIYTPRADSLLKVILREEGQDFQSNLNYSRKNRKYSDVTYTDITFLAGLDSIRASRIAWGDYNKDGYQDMLLDGCRLFRNVLGKEFVDVTDSVFVDTIRANGGIWGDFDNDGDLDIVTKDPEAIWLFTNGQFHKVVSDSTIADNEVSTEGLGCGDVDQDGYLDVYLANYEKDYDYHTDQFYLGNGKGMFREMTEELGLLPADGKNRAGRGVTMSDFDNDKDLDIFVSNYRLTENFLWVNLEGKSFENRASIIGVSGVETEGWWGHTIGSEWGDSDNDGDLDLICANLAHPRYIDFSDKTMLYINNGAPDFNFHDVRATAGIRFEETHSEPAWGDLDNDGFLDLYINDVYEGRRSFLYMNNRNNTFREVTYLAGVRHFNGWGVSFADFDNDGDLDILAAGGYIQLFRNDTVTNGNWLQIEVIGADHADGIGTRLTLSNEKFLMIREIQGGKGSTNQHSLVQHFGLADNQPPFTLKLSFPSGKEESAVIWEINKKLVIREFKD